MSSYEIIKSMKFQNPILCANFDCTQSLIVDSQGVLYLLCDDFSPKAKLALVKHKEKNKHYFSHTFSASSTMAAISNANRLTVVSYKDEKFVKSFEVSHHLKKIVFTNFSQSGRYLLSGSFDSKVYLYDLSNKTVRYVFNNRPDFCSYATVSNNNNFVFVGYFNGENLLLCLKDDKVRYFELQSPIECAKFFDEDRKLFLSDRDCNSIIYDCESFQVLSVKVLFNQWASRALLSPNGRYLLVGTRRDHLYILDPFNNKVVQTVELEYSGVTSLSLCENLLQISFSDASLLKIDLAYQKEEFLIQVGLKEYHKAAVILEQNSFLHIDEAIEKFKAGYAQALQKAKHCIAQKEYEKALELVSPFMVFEEFKKELDMLFMQQDFIGEFVQSCQEKNLLNAYAIAEKYSIIQSLHSYEVLEKQFHKSFSQAKKSIEEDQLRGVEVAKKILFEYEKIPQKSEVVKQLLHNHKRFAQAQELIKEQDFRSYFKLLNQYGFLKNTLLYDKVESLAQSLYTQALEAMQENDYTQAKNIFLKLKAFPTFQKEANSKIEKIELLLLFEKLINKNEKEKVYELVSAHPYLAFLQSFKLFNSDFEEVMKMAAFQVKSNKLELALKILAPYFGIKPLQKRIDNCIKRGYIAQVSSTYTTADMQQFLAKYNFLFGLDDEVEAAFTKIERSKEYAKFKKSPIKIEVNRYPLSFLD